MSKHSLASDGKQADINAIHRVFRDFKRDSFLIGISSLAVIAAIVSILLSVSAINQSSYARIQIDMELRATRKELEQLQDSVTISANRTARLHAWLQANGITIEE